MVRILTDEDWEEYRNQQATAKIERYWENHEAMFKKHYASILAEGENERRDFWCWLCDGYGTPGRYCEKCKAHIRQIKKKGLTPITEIIALLPEKTYRARILRACIHAKLWSVEAIDRMSNREIMATPNFGKKSLLHMRRACEIVRRGTDDVGLLYDQW